MGTFGDAGVSILQPLIGTNQGGLAAIFAVQLISIGVISAQSKRYFEDAYHLATASYRRVRQLEDRFDEGSD